MFTFSSQIEVPPGSTLAGYGDQITHKTSQTGILEVHGIRCDTTHTSWEICSIDSLYAGVLSKQPFGSRCRRIIAASHTHFAPMLDPTKPKLGIFSAEIAQSYMHEIEHASREVVYPNTCTILRGEVDIPVYRRFDFPGSQLDRLLTRYAGFFPNDEYPIDKSINLFVFSRNDTVLFASVYHACHPVTRQSNIAASPDYVQSLRKGVKERFGTSHCLFFLGCAGDIRPNLSEKRVGWLPRGRLNWHFNYHPTLDDQEMVDRQYYEAVLNCSVITSFSISDSSFNFTTRNVNICGIGKIDVPQLWISDQVIFSFLPFEVSHRYHMETFCGAKVPRKIIVSCANNTYGYLPHPNQLEFGGYEVDGSRRIMGLDKRVKLERADLW
jgi:hypothetical protein